MSDPGNVTRERADEIMNDLREKTAGICSAHQVPDPACRLCQVTTPQEPSE